MGRRSYAGGARALTLTAPVTDSTSSLPVTVPVSWPDGADGPFSAVIARGFDDEEKVLCDTVAGGFLSVVFRGYDGTTPQAHDAGRTIEHIGTGTDFDEANAHVNSSVDVHGLSGGDQVVGEVKAATLRNKTMSGSQNTFTNIPLAASSETATEISNLHGTDVTLQNNINAEATSRAAADSAEATARTTADTTLQANIDAEASARIATDNTKANQSTTYTKTEVDAAIAALTPKIASQQVVASTSVLGLISDGAILSLPAISFDGTTTVTVAASIDHVASGQDGGRVMVGIALDGSYIATKQYRGAWNTDNLQLPVEISHTFTPSAGSHTITLRAVRNVGTGAFDFVMGSGGGSPGTNAGPGQLRISQTR